MDSIRSIYANYENSKPVVQKLKTQPPTKGNFIQTLSTTITRLCKSQYKQYTSAGS